MNITILPNYFLNNDGTFNKEEALKLSGKIAGVCYDEEGFNHLNDELEEKTMRRVKMTLNNGHHSVYDHISISFNLEKVPKILAMVLNNEHEYTTSEKSARYTKIANNNSISDNEVRLYNKWCLILKDVIKKQYEGSFSESKIQKLAQENARYFVSVFVPTEMIYTTSLRQINYIASWFKEYISSAKSEFELKLSSYMREFIYQLKKLNVLDERLMINEKHRSLSLFGKCLDKKDEYFGNVYFTTYKGTFSELAQAQRHRTLDYQMEIMDEKEYFVPPIIIENKKLSSEWNNDMNSVKSVVPQGEIIKISESGKYEDFILKCKERLCSAAQLEIMQQTKKTLLNYRNALESKNDPLLQDIIKYSHGARCTFPDFDCLSDCKFFEGKTLTRRI